jgi:hypothetical protein
MADPPFEGAAKLTRTAESPADTVGAAGVDGAVEAKARGAVAKKTQAQATAAAGSKILWYFMHVVYQIDTAHDW